MSAPFPQKPLDVLLADLDFLTEYLEEVAGRFESEADTEQAELARSWIKVVEEAQERLGH